MGEVDIRSRRRGRTLPSDLLPVKFHPMTISSLISELQKLQALHGDLPVTIAAQDGGDHDVVRDVDPTDDLYFDHLSEVFANNGPHIHLS